MKPRRLSTEPTLMFLRFFITSKEPMFFQAGVYRSLGFKDFINVTRNFLVKFAASQVEAQPLSTHGISRFRNLFTVKSLFSSRLAEPRWRVTYAIARDTASVEYSPPPRHFYARKTGKNIEPSRYTPVSHSAAVRLCQVVPESFRWEFSSR